MSYVNPDDFLAYVGSTVSADEDIITRDLAAAEARVDEYCGRSFAAPSGSATKTYVPDNANVVTIHDLVDATNIVVADNGATLDADDFQLEPLQQWAGARTYYRIRRLNGWWYQFGCGRPTISVTSARWGWASVPAEVTEAVFLLGKDLVHLRENRFGVAGFGEFGAVRVRDNPHVKMLLDPYRHPSKIGIA